MRTFLFFLNLTVGSVTCVGSKVSNMDIKVSMENLVHYVKVVRCNQKALDMKIEEV